MDFLGIGPLELILILILGFLFFGPEKLPGMAAKAGKLYRNFRKATFDISRNISEELSAEDKSPEKTTSILPLQLPTNKDQVHNQTSVSISTQQEKPHE